MKCTRDQSHMILRFLRFQEPSGVRLFWVPQAQYCRNSLNQVFKQVSANHYTRFEADEGKQERSLETVLAVLGGAQVG